MNEVNMKKTKVRSLLFAIVFSIAPISLFGAGNHDHSHDHDGMMEFDPVENEFGSYEPEMKVTRTIMIDMSDSMRFSPDVIKVKQGEVIRFVNTNSGQLMHEFVLGTPGSLDEHAELMKKFPNMEHAEPYMTHVAPGEKGEIVWRFTKAGEFAFGCLIPGHFDAGMKGKVIVGS